MLDSPSHAPEPRRRQPQLWPPHAMATMTLAPAPASSSLGWFPVDLGTSTELTTRLIEKLRLLGGHKSQELRARILQRQILSRLNGEAEFQLSRRDPARAAPLLRLAEQVVTMQPGCGMLLASGAFRLCAHMHRLVAQQSTNGLTEKAQWRLCCQYERRVVAAERARLDTAADIGCNVEHEPATAAPLALALLRLCSGLLQQSETQQARQEAEHLVSLATAHKSTLPPALMTALATELTTQRLPDYAARLKALGGEAPGISLLAARRVGLDHKKQRKKGSNQGSAGAEFRTRGRPAKPAGHWASLGFPTTGGGGGKACRQPHLSQKSLKSTCRIALRRKVAESMPRKGREQQRQQQRVH